MKHNGSSKNLLLVACCCSLISFGGRSKFKKVKPFWDETLFSDLPTLRLSLLQCYYIPIIMAARKGNHFCEEMPIFFKSFWYYKFHCCKNDYRAREKSPTVIVDMIMVVILSHEMVLVFSVWCFLFTYISWAKVYYCHWNKRSALSLWDLICWLWLLLFRSLSENESWLKFSFQIPTREWKTAVSHHWVQ